MAGYHENQILKELAARYVEHYGEMLKDEAARLNRQPGITPRMDSKVRQYMKSGGTRRYAAGLAALAAMVAIVMLIPMLMNLHNSNIAGQESGAPSSTAPAQAESAAPAPEPEAPAGSEILPLSFTLPENLTVTGSKLDNGKSVYYLLNSGLDDIVMTMELAPEEDVFAGLRQTRINDCPVYYKYTADFSVMAFQKQDITYVLTCKYDVNTLVPLAEAIL